ncbi:efflux RND transporter periplasmic adaptor subunit [Engelhardtia mirabilis]|uniref:Efflux system component YknX n=1 Tax=Engelhardtia mirabilis TaxID=2528011 RepID=A0A518BSF6_9BACT|nr:Putative efflux system component YknX [Planctomycetes bacterium Pla133]QDV04221.1 Putative efflux system component YknX [Planctomycetes bacterium Pla86]
MTFLRSLLAHRWPVLVVLLLLAALAWKAATPTSVLVDLGEVRRGALRVTVDDDGRTRVVDRFTLAAPIAGSLVRVSVDPGDPVVAGQTPLVRFRPADPSLLDARGLAQARVQVERASAAAGTARTALESAIADRDYAAAQAERIEALAAKGSETPESLERARRDLRQAQAAVSAAEFGQRVAAFDVALARTALIGTPDESNLALEAGGLELRGVDRDGEGELTLSSPVDGVVLSVRERSARALPAGAPILDVGDTTALELVADFLTQEAVLVEPGMEVLVEGWGATDAPALRGVVRRVEPSGFTKVSALGVEEQRVNILVDPTGDAAAWSSLGDGFRVELRVVIWEADDVLQVPAGALFRDGGEWAVYVVEGDRARRRRVEVGRTSGLATEIRSGLTADERVVLFPSELIEDGTRIESH